MSGLLGRFRGMVENLVRIRLCVPLGRDGAMVCMEMLVFMSELLENECPATLPYVAGRRGRPGAVSRDRACSKRQAAFEHRGAAQGACVCV